MTGGEGRRLGLVGRNGIGKSTLLRLIAGEIARRAEAGTASLDELAEADWTREARLIAALAAVGLDAGPETPLARLSGGQRSRAAIAAATFGDPDFLLLDEPTNNLDRAGHDAVTGLLDGWRGGAIVVSHDEAFLAAIGIGRRLELVGGRLVEEG